MAEKLLATFGHDMSRKVFKDASGENSEGWIKERRANLTARKNNKTPNPFVNEFRYSKEGGMVKSNLEEMKRSGMSMEMDGLHSKAIKRNLKIDTEVNSPLEIARRSIERISNITPKAKEQKESKTGKVHSPRSNEKLSDMFNNPRTGNYMFRKRAVGREKVSTGESSGSNIYTRTSAAKQPQQLNSTSIRKDQSQVLDHSHQSSHHQINPSVRPTNSKLSFPLHSQTPASLQYLAARDEPQPTADTLGANPRSAKRPPPQTNILKKLSAPEVKIKEIMSKMSKLNKIAFQ